MAAEYLAWELRRHGLQESPIREADCLLVTCTAATDWKYLRNLRKKYPGKRIIAGGAASTSPASLGMFADVVCVGDGQAFLRALFRGGIKEAASLPNAWIDGQSKQIEIDQSFPWDLPPIQAEDGAYRLWCGRGCKNKCLFCQTGWGVTYQENPDPGDLVMRAKSLLAQGKKINYLSNDIAQHTFYASLPPVEHGSYSVNYLAKHGLPPARQIRLGIEGVSERLRAAVNKPISYDDLLKCTIWLNNNGKSVRWFLIAGLPSEADGDWLELRRIIQDYKAHTVKGVLALSFTAWCPDPATPLAPCPLDDGYWQRFAEFREWFFGGPGWSNRIKLMSPQQPAARLEKAMASMCLNEKALRTGGQWGPNDRVNYPYKGQAKKAHEVFCGRYLVASTAS